jgi:hypothetical protein
MNTTSWGLVAVLLVAVVIMFPLSPLTHSPKATDRPQATPVNKTLPYRPSETMGSNKVSYKGLDTKALCATTDVCI